MDESTLPRRLARDLDGTFEDVVLLYSDRLYRFALRLTGNPSDAEEIAQDALVRAYRAMEGYAPERTTSLALRPWLYQIAVNVARNRTRRRTLQAVPLDAGGGVTDNEPLPDVLAEREERALHLQTLIGALPERQRAAIILRYIEDLSYAEIAQVLEQPEGTIRANVHRATATLRRMLTEQPYEVMA